MPYLNWKEEQLAVQAVEPIEPGESAASSQRMRMRLALTAAQRAALLPVLTEVLGQGNGGELRLDLPRGWIVFWKKRDGQSRLLLAHPQTEEWVATAALDESHAQALVAAIGVQSPGQALDIESLGSVDRVSNLELVIEAA